MSLKDTFNSKSYNYSKLNDAVLEVRSVNQNVEYFYDFGMRLMTAQYGQALSTQPFSQLDREMLIELREKLIELKGNPPELAAEQPASPPGPRKFTA